MYTFSRVTLDDAVNLMPGVTSANSGGSRNERLIFVRGFDRFQVPLSLDGIRVCLPADNRLDYGRFLTPDIDTSCSKTERGTTALCSLGATYAADRRVGPAVNSLRADLGAFRTRGGRLLQYHGWIDPLISPYNSIDYREAVVASLPGKDRSDRITAANGFYRLFMLPGVAHCRGGDGPDTIDGLEVLQRWVENAQPPERIDAVRLADGRVVRSRPLCPYPQVAKYVGKGSSDEATNFYCE